MYTAATRGSILILADNIESVIIMNVFELIFANTASLTIRQQTLQRAIRTFIISIITAILLEITVILQAPALDAYSIGLLLASAVIGTAGHALEPILLQQGFSQSDVAAIEKTSDNLSSQLNTVAEEQQKK